MVCNYRSHLFCVIRFCKGKFEPRRSPKSAREISNTILNQGQSMPLTEKGVTHMTMQFGQFLDHDITLTPEAGFT